MPRALAWFVIAIASLRLAGGDLLVLQVAAWGGMIATRTADEGLVKAMETTFDGAHPCRLCAAVKHAAAKEDKPASTAPAKAKAETARLKEFPAAIPFRLPAALQTGSLAWAEDATGLMPQRHDAPLLPPPRALA